MVLKIERRQRQQRVYPLRRWYRSGMGLMIPVVAMILWLGYKQLQSYWTTPDAIFVLGGHEERERLAAQLAQQHPHLPIWISSGSPQGYVEAIFAHAGIDRDRLHLNYRATDTVTNFTTLVDELKRRGIDSVYLVTSDNHMTRARIVGEIVFGSRGIVLKPIAVPSHAPDESLEKSVRDGFRAILWITTGKTGESLSDIHSLRQYYRKLRP